MIGDGDSSTFKRITDANAYKKPSLAIEKIECVSHLYRKCRKKLLLVSHPKI